MTLPDGAPTAAPVPFTASVAVGSLREAVDLIWEDEPPGSPNWWLSRTRSGELQIFIAPDQLTSSLLCLTRSSVRPGAYDVLIVMPDIDAVSQGNPLDLAKMATARKLARPDLLIGRSLTRWRIHRGVRIALNQLPLAAVAFLLGAVLGLAVGLFAVSTSLVGWPMVAIGILLGAISGPILKWLIDRRFNSLLGPWGRFWLATGAAALGAMVGVGGLLGLFWPH